MDKISKRYRTQITLHQKNHYIGVFNSEEDAARAFDRWVIKHCDLNAATNFPRSNYTNDSFHLPDPTQHHKGRQRQTRKSKKTHMSTDQAANHELMLACLRLSSASTSNDEHHVEWARSNVIKIIAVLIEKFGLINIATYITKAAQEQRKVYIPMRTTDQNANHALQLSCRRLDRAIIAGNQQRSEAARHNIIEHIADLLGEFGLLDVAQAVRDELPQFDGRHIEDAT